MKAIDKIIENLCIPAGIKLLDLIFSTAKVTIIDPEHQITPFFFGSTEPRPSPRVFAFWHGKLLPVVYCFRESNVYGLVSRSRDGEFLYSAFRRLGINAVRGSTSRGQIASAKALVRLLESGYHVALAPDGPKGPRWKAQAGAVAVARLAGVPIVPVGCGISRKKTFGSWDKFELPLPFARIVFVVGEVIRAGSGELDALTEELETELTRLTTLAEKMAAGDTGE